MAEKYSRPYRRIEQMFSEDELVVLDGGVATELERAGVKDFRISDEALWGTWALSHAPNAVLEVHRRYVAAGCDVLSTDTWAITSAPEMEARHADSGHSHWMDLARRGIRVAGQAIKEAGREADCALAFSINGDVDTPERRATLELLTRVLAESPPDLILMETLSLIRENLTIPAVEIMLQTGLPVWLSFRRCRHGVCGVHGQHWGGPEGDLFGRAARELEKLGIRALLINCLPVSHVPGMLPWLRDFTDLPLGVYPNLGRYLDPGWKFDPSVGPNQYVELARAWREEGAQIIGGCCGTSPEHIAAVKKELVDGKAGRRQSTPQLAAPVSTAPIEVASRIPQPWLDSKRRNLFPLPFPEIIVDPDVFRPTQGSFLVWKRLFTSGVGKGKRCLDVGCGCGILTVQLALNGATEVQAIDIQREAVANTLANAFRNDVADRVKGTAVDLYAYQPEHKYDVVVASLYQMPVDPLRRISGHRPIDFWGRNMLDHLINLLPSLLERAGTALVMQLSVLSQVKTAELMERAGLDCQVIDYAFFHFSPVFTENLEQIQRVEQLSDAYHLKFADQNVIVMYLLEVKHQRDDSG
jgi:S-methylmethionine-dependent homocysteine/selenocysteine methylase